MLPMRNGTIRWETLLSFEDALNKIDDEIFFGGLFDGKYGKAIDRTRRLFFIGKQEIINVWTGKETSQASLAELSKLTSATLTVRFDGKSSLVRTFLSDHPTYKIDDPRLHDLFENIVHVPAADSVDHENWREINKIYAESLPKRMEAVVVDGLAEWMLRGRTRDVRACLWCGWLFRADRANALFHKTSCRIAYHRAVTTAEKHRIDETASELTGVFRCVECNVLKLLSASSGLMRDEHDGSVFIDEAGSERGVCRGCAARNHAEWADYVAPLTLSPYAKGLE